MPLNWENRKAQQKWSWNLLQLEICPHHKASSAPDLYVQGHGFNPWVMFFDISSDEFCQLLEESSGKVVLMNDHVPSYSLNLIFYFNIESVIKTV